MATAIMIIRSTARRSMRRGHGIEPVDERRDFLIAHCLNPILRLRGIYAKRLEWLATSTRLSMFKESGAISVVSSRGDLLGADHSCLRH